MNPPKFASARKYQSERDAKPNHVQIARMDMDEKQPNA